MQYSTQSEVIDKENLLQWRTWASYTYWIINAKGLGTWWRFLRRRLDITLQSHEVNSVGIATNWMENDVFGINTIDTTIKYAKLASPIHIWTCCCYVQGYSLVWFLSFVTTGCIYFSRHLPRSSAEEHNIANTEGFHESYPTPRHRSMSYHPVDISVDC